jgi:hypothetical protein
MRWLSRSQKYKALSGPTTDTVRIVDLLIREPAHTVADER